ncbi:MAG: putative beta-lysine N-acetyltransferase [Sedimentisphaerales bacterium]|nr:putative beta-lysine N-acetyltransferase [Sedimentisphaerales bacterium]
MTDKIKSTDRIEPFRGALIQHGPLSNRIYLMKLNQADPNLLIPAMDELAISKGYTKIFAKIPAIYVEVFLSAGYQQEAKIPGFYHGQEPAGFMGKYLSDERKIEKSLDEIEGIRDLAFSKIPSETMVDTTTQHDVVIRLCIPADAKRMSELYSNVFASYPFPIDTAAYITETMLANIAYYCVEVDNELAALASSEMDTISRNVEMTDFATLPKFRGRNFAGLLLGYMERDMKNHGILTSYTIARAISAGINITFAKADYKYAGRLINNTNIAGQIESMNVWYKNL